MSAEEQAIKYVVGDATAPEGEGLKIIAHCCNNLGAWGAGFVLALSRKWERPEREYREWCERHGKDGFRKLLGATQLVPVERDVWVANIIGQDGVGASKGVPPIRYEAISRGFLHIAEYAEANPEREVSVHAPRLGCGLAGGEWPKVADILEQCLTSKGIPVTIYDLP